VLLFCFSIGTKTFSTKQYRFLDEDLFILFFYLLPFSSLKDHESLRHKFFAFYYYHLFIIFLTIIIIFSFYQPMKQTIKNGTFVLFSSFFFPPSSSLEKTNETKPDQTTLF